MWRTLFLAVAVFAGELKQLSAVDQKAYFYVSEGSKRCFTEHTPVGLPVTVSFATYDNPGIACTVGVADPSGTEVAKYVVSEQPSGRLTYLTKEPGYHTICVTCPSSKWFGQTMLKWTLNVDLGDTEINLEAAAKGHAMESNEKLIRNLADRFNMLHAENAFHEDQESALNESTEKLERRVIHCALLQMGVVLLATIYSVVELRKHFRSQKLVD